MNEQQIAAWEAAAREQNERVTPEELDEPGRKYLKSMHQKIGIQDAAENLNQHLPEICQFGKEQKMTSGQALDFVIKTIPREEPDPDIKRNIFRRRGIKLESDKDGSSSPINKVLNHYDLSFLMTEYQNDVFFNGIHDSRFWATNPANPLTAKAKTAQELRAAAITRTAALDDSSNLQTVGMNEMAYPLLTDVMIADIIGTRTVIRNNRYLAPSIKEPEDYKLTGIGELADIDVWEMKTGEKMVVTNKAGFGVMSSYEALRTSDLYVEQMTEFTNWIRFITQQDLVNEGLTVLTSGTFSTGNDNLRAATTGTLSATDIVDINLLARKGRKKKGFAFNLIIAGKDFLTQYAVVDITQNSNNEFPLTPRNRTFVDSIRAGQTIIWRENDEVANMNSNSKDAYFVDRRFCLRYIMERNSTIEETERKMSNQSMTTYNTFSYAFTLMEPAENARLKTSTN